MEDRFAAAVSNFFSSDTNGLNYVRNWGTKSFQSFNEDQMRFSDVSKKKPNIKTSKHRPSDSESDEELKAALEKALEKHKKNKKKEEPRENTSVTKSETSIRQNFNVYQCSKTEKNISNGTNDGADIIELVNYFFGSRNQNMKSYSEYQKQGALPKVKIKNESNTPKFLQLEKSKSKGNRGAADILKSPRNKQELNSLSDNETVRVNQDIFYRPFFYIVPENPSPNFFLPRGSYYVTPNVPFSSREDEIVFHPEIGAESKKKRTNGNKVSENVIQDSSKMNDLSKKFDQKMDSHLNIGPLDVKINDSSKNLESNCELNKSYNKEYMALDDGGNVSGEDFVNEMIEGNKAECQKLNRREYRLEVIEQHLLSEFPHLSSAELQKLTETYLDSEIDLKTFIASKKLKFEQHYKMLRLALPESNCDELMAVSTKFLGEEALLEEYIARVKYENKICRHVLELQHIFPDADPKFLLKNVEDLNGSEDAISTFTNELLESQNYPKISDDPRSREKKRLWNNYVINFDVNKYIRDVGNPEDINGEFGNSTQVDISLVYKYLQAKYPSRSLDDLKDHFKSFNKNLVTTCQSLNSTEQNTLTIRPWQNSVENEDYTETFLKKICYVEHQKEIDNYLNEMKERREIEMEEARVNDWFLTCPLCSDNELVASVVVTCPDGHVFCKDCIKTYISMKISDGVYKFVCPLETCETFFMLSTLENLLSETAVLNIIKKQQAEEISIADVEGLETCPYCEFAYIPNPEDNIFKCQNPACLIETCRKCKDKNHIPLRCEEIERPADLEARKKIEETMTKKLVRVCPKCQKKIVKVDGCNKIACSCGALFCYICRQSISGYEHFNRTRSHGCPLYTNNELLHNTDVFEAGVQARDEILRENPNIRILHDPTKLQ